MAVAHDASTGATRNGTSSTTYSFSHTCTGSNRALVSAARTDANDTISGITYNSVSMSLLNTGTQSGNGRSLYVFGLAAPATGSNTVQVTAAGADNITAGAVSFTGVDQTTPFENVTTNTGTSSAPTVTVTSAADDMVVDAYSSQWGSVGSAGSGQTAWSTFADNENFVDLPGSYQAGAASVVMDWTGDNPDAFFSVGANIAAAAAAGGGGSHTLTLLGVG